jgi:hypothetical protein
MNIAEIQFALDKHGFRLIDKLPNGELLVREKTPQENIKHKDGIEEEDFYRAWNAGQVRRVSDGQIMNPQIKDASPQCPWVGLTHDQTKDCIKAWDGNDAYVLCRAIEAKLKERNT